jgi:putative transcriptional regulator
MKPRHDLTSHVKRYRLRSGEMTQQGLAEHLGVTRQTIHAIEKGRYAPSVGLALMLAEIFGVRVEDLFTLTKDGDDA